MAAPYRLEFHGTWWIPIRPSGKKAKIGSTDKDHMELVVKELNRAFEVGRRYGRKERKDK